MKVVQTFIVEENGTWTTLHNCGEQGWCWINEAHWIIWIDEVEANRMITFTKDRYSIPTE